MDGGLRRCAKVQEVVSGREVEWESVRFQVKSRSMSGGERSAGDVPR